MPEAVRTQLVAMGQMAVSRDPGTALVTHALGSCIGLTAYDPESGIGGLVHCMLPLSSIACDTAASHPCMFVDAGTTALLRALKDAGVPKSRLVLRAAGGAELLGDAAPFQIGQRNRTVLIRILEKNGMLLAGQDLGGRAARSMALHLADGNTIVRKDGRESIV